MKKYYYITYSESIENEQIIKDRIKQYDDYINFLDHNWFIYTDDEAKDVYQKISKGEFENNLILVLQVNFAQYWGRMNKTLWEWIKKERS